jgi:hypothetical protein
MTLNQHQLTLSGPAALGGFGLPAQARTAMRWWQPMTGDLNEDINGRAQQFNGGQKNGKIVPGRGLPNKVGAVEMQIRALPR